MLINKEELTNVDYSLIKRKIDNDYKRGKSDWATFWSESSIDVRLEAGDVSLIQNNNGMIGTSARTMWSFNRVRPLLNLVSGHQRRSRKSTIVVPLDNGDQITADQFTKIIMGIYKRENVYESISEAFHQGACVTGLNLLHVYLDFRNDPINGDIKVDNLAYNQFYMDPLFRKTDLSDCNFIWRRSYISYEEAASLMPDKYKAIMDLPANTSGAAQDLKFQYMPENYGMTRKNSVAYDEYYYRSYRSQKLLVDKESGDTLDVSNKPEIDIERFLDENPRVILMEQSIPTVRLAIMMQEEVVFDGPQPLGIDIYPFVPVLGYYNPMMPTFYSRIQGIARSLRDPQTLFNRQMISANDILESQINSGWIFKEEAVLDVNHLFQTGPGRMIPLKRGAQMTDVQPIPISQVPPAIFQLMESSSKELNMVSGINEELIGSAIDDKAGILSALRQGAGLTTLQPLFDRLNLSQNLLGNIMLQTIQANYTPAKVSKFLEGQQPAPLFYNKAFGKYHCMIEEGFDTESQRQLAFAQLIQLKEMGINVPAKHLIESATLQNKTELIQAIEEADQQAAQIQQAQVQAEVVESAARTELAKARTIADKGLGVERLSRVAENEQLAIERKAQGEKEEMEAVLNFLKASKEIEHMDVSHLKELIAIKNMLREQQTQTLESGNLESKLSKSKLYGK